MSTGVATRRDPGSVHEFGSIALVDAALGQASHREFFTHDEAAQLMHDVRVSVRDVTLGAAVASVVNDALLSYGHDELLAQPRLVDPLLDIRLALTRGNSRREAGDRHAAS